MKSFVAAFFVAMCVCALLTPLVRRFALRLGAVSQAGGRHVHARSVPRLGGLAIAAAVCAPLVSLFIVDSGAAVTVRAKSEMVMGVLLGGAVLCLVGAVDDVRGLRAIHKLGFQVVAALIAYAVGLRIEVLYLPGLGSLPMGIFAIPITVLWIVGVTNAVNLIDGLDGLAAGVVFFAALTNFSIALLSGNVLLAALMASVMGALIGFLFYNFNPARIFMGDSGSYFLGFVLATTAIAGTSQKASTAVALLGPMVALGLPLFDTLFSVLRRALERRPLFSPDRGHIHHRLLDMGVTHKKAVLLLYGVSIALTGAGIAISLDRQWETGVALLFSLVILGGLVRFVGYFEYLQLRKRQSAGERDPQTERLRRLVPGFLLGTSKASSLRELWHELECFAERAQLASFECRGIDEALVHDWRAENPQGRELVRARFFIGPPDTARLVVRFTWNADGPDVPPTSDVLLQLVADAVEQALLRLHSEWAPSGAVSVKTTKGAATTPLESPAKVAG